MFENAKIVKINPSFIELSGLSFSDGKRIQKIMDICHQTKHLYLEGYPCGRKTRKNSGLKIKKWNKCPGICFTYLVTNDNKLGHLVIRILVSDEDKLRERYTETEINFFRQMFVQEIADRIISYNENPRSE